MLSKAHANPCAWVCVSVAVPDGVTMFNGAPSKRREMDASGGAAGGSAVSKTSARKGGARGVGDGAAAGVGDTIGDSAERARFGRSAAGFSAELRGGDGAAGMRGRAAAPPKNDANVSGLAGREPARKRGAAAAAFTALSGGLKKTARFGSGDAVGDCGAR